MDGTPKSILPDDLNARLGTAFAPAVFDVRRRMSFDAPDIASVDNWALALSSQQRSRSSVFGSD
jgi:hypothetical protein